MFYVGDASYKGFEVVSLGKRVCLLSLLLTTLYLLGPLPLIAQPVEIASDLSKENFPSDDDYQIFFPLIVNSKSYSFFVAGHTYGIPEVNNPGVHPPFKALWPQINSYASVFGVFTGDIVIRGAAVEWNEIDADLEKLNSPVYFAVGNHDMIDRELFISRYGPTYYSFEHANDLFIVLDSEIDHFDIIGKQMTFLQGVLEKNSWQNVFVFVHKLIWIVEDTPYQILRNSVNNSKEYSLSSNFWTDVEPLLAGLDAKVYVIAGDVGVTWAMSMFYQEHENIHLIASGMGGSEEENYLLFNVDAAGVEIIAQRLDGQPLNQEKLEAYNLLYYNDSQRDISVVHLDKPTFRVILKTLFEKLFKWKNTY